MNNRYHVANKNSVKKKALVIASVASMLDNFNRSNIDILLELGYDVTAAANFHTGEDINSQAKIDEFSGEMKGKRVQCVHIDFSRRVSNVRQQLRSIRQVRQLLARRFDLIHCHSPICAAIVRAEAQRYRKRYGCKVIYTAHGFHFYNGAPLKNWFFYYPAEKLLSHWTDVLITINCEDYRRARKKFNAKKTVYIPGVGVDTEKFAVCKTDRKAKRAELGVRDSDFLLLSVGELSERKNQKIVIEALGKMKQDGNLNNIVYLVVGKGKLESEFKRIIVEYNLENHVRLLGYRTDIDGLCETADCFVHPSVREGLGIAPLEAMAAGLPLISSYVNGMKDYAVDGVSGCCVNPLSVDDMVKAIERMKGDKIFRNRCAGNNYKTSKKFDIQNSKEFMSKIYGGGINIS